MTDNLTGGTLSWLKRVEEVTQPQPVVRYDDVFADTPHKTLEFISILRIGAYVACAIFSTITNKDRKFGQSLTPVFAVEAIHQITLFTYEFLIIYYADRMRFWGFICDILVVFMQYLSVVIAVVYLFYLLLLFRKYFVVPFLSSLVFITLLFFIDAFRKDDSLCFSRQYTGYAWNLMMLASIIEVIAIVALFSAPFWHYNLSDVKEQFYIALTVAVTVRIPNFIVLYSLQASHSLPLIGQIILRALPIAFPAVFYYKLRREKSGRDRSRDRA